MLALSRRRPVRTDEGLSFKTPDEWLDEPGIRRKYDDMVFDRTAPGGRSAEKVIGVGHNVFDKALRVAAEYPVSLAWTKDIEHPLVVFQVYDRITDQSGRIRQAVVGVERDESAGDDGWGMLRDWQVLERLNSVKPREPTQDAPSVAWVELRDLLDEAATRLSRCVGSFGFPFKVPEARPIACIWVAK
jgi:hypothetical protein